jgi:twitching motility protein PilT
VRGANRVKINAFQRPAAGMALALHGGMVNLSADPQEPAFAPASFDIQSQPTSPTFPALVREAAPQRRLIDELFRRMCTLGASDLHLSATMAPLVRLDGEMRRLDEAAGPLTADMVMRLLADIMPPENKAEFEARHDTDFAYEIAGLARFRANVFRDRHGAGAVFRVIPSKILTAETLGLSPHILALCQLTKGLVLVTGPTGSGKSTTLCALIDYINRNRADHIITIEDPIEFVHDNQKCLINQREVRSHTRSFKDALRAALREDPDVVYVGELRDLETIAIAIETAETGHLVFGTLHTTTAASTVDRIIDQFPADRQAQIRVMLSESLRGVIAQTLCKKIGGGRVAALEVLLPNSAISNLIREGKTFQIPSMMQVGRAQGMVALNDALVDLVKKKLITPEEATLRAVDKTGIAGLLKR